MEDDGSRLKKIGWQGTRLEEGWTGPKRLILRTSRWSHECVWEVGEDDEAS